MAVGCVETASSKATEVVKYIIKNDSTSEWRLLTLRAGLAKLQRSSVCRSMLKKYLTLELIDKLKDRRTSAGATLLDVVRSGLANPDSSIGIYAPDPEAYTVFADLFNPVINEYHKGFENVGFHPTVDFGDPNCLIDLDHENKYIISTRIRCGRSLKGMPLNPYMTKQQYLTLEQNVSSALCTLPGDLTGSYYPLSSMVDSVQKDLVDAHYLFKNGDRFLKAANANRYWPCGRGIYMNYSKTIFVWINEEDHLRIISMQQGGDLKSIYGRLVNAVSCIGDKLEFCHDDRLGYLTFCPTNLGTTIRASVHIRLPKLGADRGRLEAVASKFNLQVRGTSGEHTESVGGIYDISNRRRLGITEYQTVCEMQDGIRELIKIEQDM